MFDSSVYIADLQKLARYANAAGQARITKEIEDELKRISPTVVLASPSHDDGDPHYAPVIAP